MKKKFFCITLSLTLLFSTIAQGKDSVVVPANPLEINTANKVLESSTFTIDKATAKKIVKLHTKKEKLTKVEKYKKKISNLGIVSVRDDEEILLL